MTLNPFKSWKRSGVGAAWPCTVAAIRINGNNRLTGVLNAERFICQTLSGFALSRNSTTKGGKNILVAWYFSVNRLTYKCIQRLGLNRISLCIWLEATPTHAFLARVF